MKRTLACAFSILALGNGGALAANANKPTIISLDGTCDVLSITRQPVLHVAQLASADSSSCDAFFGAGLTGHDRFFGRIATFALQDPAQAGRQFLVELSYPYVTGGHYAMYYTTDGKTLHAIISDTYTVEGSAPVQVRGGNSAFRALNR